jgi:hypothetical protein
MQGSFYSLFFFDGTGIWAQGFVLEKQVLLGGKGGGGGKGEKWPKLCMHIW